MDGGNSTRIMKLGLRECDKYGEFQRFSFAKSGEIFTYFDFHCIGIKDLVLIDVPCSNEDKSQQWDYNYEVFQARC